MGSKCTTKLHRTVGWGVHHLLVECHEAVFTQTSFWRTCYTYWMSTSDMSGMSRGCIIHKAFGVLVVATHRVSTSASYEWNVTYCMYQDNQEIKFLVKNAKWASNFVFNLQKTNMAGKAQRIYWRKLSSSNTCKNWRLACKILGRVKGGHWGSGVCKSNVIFFVQ